MPKRTLTITLLTLSGKGRFKDEDYFIDDVFGEDLLNIFTDWLERHDPNCLRNEKSSNYTRVISARRGGRSVFVEGGHGRFGTPVGGVDVKTHVVDHEMSEDHAPTIPTRFVFTAPEGGEFCTFTMERQSNSSSAIAVMHEFRHFLTTKFRGLSFSLETLQLSNAWLDNADLLSVTAIQYKKPVAPEDGLVAEAFDAQIETTVRAAKGKRHLQHGVLPGLRAGALGRETILSLPAEDYDEFKVQVEHGGQTKTYSIGNEKTPRFQYMLNDDGEPVLRDEEFILECQGQLQECFSTLGLTWETKWLKKSIVKAKKFAEAELLPTTIEP